MKSSLLVRYVVTVTALVLAGGVLLSGDKVDATWLRYASAAVFVATAGLWLWEHLLWRLPLVQRIPQAPRSVRGTWQGVLTSHWVNPDTGERILSKPAFLVVRQSASQLTATLLTDESKSVSTLAAVTKTDGDTWALDYMYLNKPQLAVQHRSSMHQGSTALEISGRPATRLTGRYWTDRDSKGELGFSACSSTLADDYKAALALWTSPNSVVRGLEVKLVLSRHCGNLIAQRGS